MRYSHLLKTVSIVVLATSLSGCANLQKIWASVKTDFSSSKHKSISTQKTPVDMQAAYIVWEDVKDALPKPPAVKYASTGSYNEPLKLRPASQMNASDNLSSFAAVRQAQKTASIEPTTQNYQNAIQIYPYAPGSVFHIYAAPEQVTDIALEAGESLTSISAGDTKRWIVGDTVSGTGKQAQIHILVKPTGAPLDTNLIITTSRRTYYLELHAKPDSYMTAISWHYPNVGLAQTLRPQSGASLVGLNLAGLNLEGVKTLASQNKSMTPDLANLNFSYKIKGDHPNWRPVRAFDDGKKVFIQFPVTLAKSEAPPLFISGPKGKAQMVNYRVKGRYYVVDRLFEKAELRLGEKKQTVVKIVRKRNPS